jgi:hypothetical protein
MNGLYWLLLFLFGFGVVIGFFNGVNAFPGNKLPDAGYKIDNSTVTELQSAGASMSSSDFSIWNLIQIFMTSLGSGITSLFLFGYVVYGLAIMVGMDPSLAANIGILIQSCVTFVTLWGLYELWTGRSVT